MSVPSSPQITIRPLATSGALQFYWSTPASDGGSPITGYTLSCAGLSSQSLGASTYTYTYTGLTNGTAYTFSITAENTNGSSPAATFRTVKPGGKPGPVQSLAVSRAAAPAATLSWTAPASDGGAALLGYTVKAVSTDPEDPVIKQSVSPGTTTTTISGLTSDSVYNYSVNAVNDPGYSPEEKSGLYSITSASCQIPITGKYNGWTGVACDMSGTKVLAATGFLNSISQPLYRSTDGGTTWKETATTEAGYKQWRRTASSADGTKLVAAASSSYIYTSTDSGETWVQRTSAGSFAWSGLACSADGSVIIASTPSQLLRLSTDGGANWTTVTAAGSLGWYGVGCSANGQTLAACSTTFVWLSTDRGVTWTQQTALGSRTWENIACSSDGTKIFTCSSTNTTIYRTIDSGANWSAVLTIQPNPGSNYLSGIACSYDGTRIYVTTRFSIYVSTDSGTTWTRRLVKWSTTNNNLFYYITCSADGMVAYAVKTNETIWKTGDGGITWRELNTPRANQTFQCCMSSNGVFQYITDQVGGNVYKSTDKGNSWTTIQIPGTTALRWICCSSDGTNVALTDISTGGTGYVWTSADGGVTFTRQTASGSRAWRGIACDTTGTKLVAADFGSGGYIYTSTDSGVTWTQRTGAGASQWYSVACSADGTKILASNYSNGRMSVSLDSGATWTASITAVFAGAASFVGCSSDFSKLYISLNGGGPSTTYSSTNGGLNWTSMGAPWVSYRNIAVSSDGTVIVVANDTGAGSVISTDSGATWNTLPNTVNKYFIGAAISSDASIVTLSTSAGIGQYIYFLVR